MARKICSSLDWVEGDKYHIYTRDDRFYVSIGIYSGEKRYSAWDTRKAKAKYGPHPDGGECALLSYNNGFLQDYKTLSGAIKRCEREANK